MTYREKYNVYCDMYDKTSEFSKKIREKFEKQGYKVYSDFVSVQEESTRTYFCDIEIGGSPEKYRRIYGRISEAELIKLAN